MDKILTNLTNRKIWKSNQIQIYILFFFLIKQHLQNITVKLPKWKSHNMFLLVGTCILLIFYTNQGNPRWRTCFGTVWRSGSHTGTRAPDSGPSPARHTTGTSSSLSENQGRQNLSKCFIFLLQMHIQRFFISFANL